jgi:hypothetical protein
MTAIDPAARTLLEYMKVIIDAVHDGCDEVTKPYFDANAIRVVGTTVEFHKERFLAEMAKQMSQMDRPN